ncbi:MAG: LysR family transcriptional regulator [Acidimicrobiales bacterium]
MELDRWLGIEMRHLAALKAIAEEGTFRAAATRLGYTQSAVSQQVATLERLVGAKLIERPGGPRPVFLTDVGTLLLRHTEAIVARLQAAQADTAAILAGGQGTLRVGTYQSVGERILPVLVPGFQAAHLGVEIRLVESESDDDLLAHVERGDLDLAFALAPLCEGPFAFVKLMSDPWMLLVPANGPMACRKEPVTLQEAAGLPMIGPRLHRCRMQIDDHFRAEGLEPHYVLRSDENGTVHNMTAAGVGVGVVPRLAVNPSDERVVALPLAPDVAPRIVALAWHRDRYRQPTAEAFTEMASTICQNLERETGLESGRTERRCPSR